MEVFVIGDEEVIHQSSAHKSPRIFRLLCLDEIHENPRQHSIRRKVGVVQKFTGTQKKWTELMVSQLNSSGIFSQDSPYCSTATMFKNYC